SRKGVMVTSGSRAAHTLTAPCPSTPRPPPITPEEVHPMLTAPGTIPMTRSPASTTSSVSGPHTEKKTRSAGPSRERTASVAARSAALTRSAPDASASPNLATARTPLIRRPRSRPSMATAQGSGGSAPFFHDPSPGVVQPPLGPGYFPQPGSGGVRPKALRMSPLPRGSHAPPRDRPNEGGERFPACAGLTALTRHRVVTPCGPSPPGRGPTRLLRPDRPTADAPRTRRAHGKRPGRTKGVDRSRAPPLAASRTRSTDGRVPGLAVSTGWVDLLSGPGARI